MGCPSQLLQSHGRFVVRWYWCAEWQEDCCSWGSETYLVMNRNGQLHHICMYGTFIYAIAHDCTFTSCIHKQPTENIRDFVVTHYSLELLSIAHFLPSVFGPCFQGDECSQWSSEAQQTFAAVNPNKHTSQPGTPPLTP